MSFKIFKKKKYFISKDFFSAITVDASFNSFFSGKQFKFNLLSFNMIFQEPIFSSIHFFLIKFFEFQA